MTRSSDLPIQRRLLDWFAREKRRLPWRGTRDPYRIWVSEVMLQQTTVAAVRRRYDAFLRRFPDLDSLARAREDSVLAAWSGLGYYARARNIHRAAREIRRRHGGVFPRDPEELRRLPGFGDYMAAAVPSLAWGLSLPAADANVTRVVSRLFAIPGTAGSKTHRGAVLEICRRLLPRTRAGDLTAALMDLGQTICTARAPECGRCPLADLCAARRRGRPESFPRRPAKPAIRRIAVAAAFVQRDGRALLVRRRGSFLAGMWEFPCGPARDGDRRAARAGLSRALAALGLRRGSTPIAAVRHTVVRRRLEIEVFTGYGTFREASEAAAGARWFTARQLEHAAIPTLTRKVARSAGFL
jgi:A/G-specific adenine glycosylase